VCTIVAASRIHPDFPLLIAANRDEFLGRPALPPDEIRPGLLAGVDLEKGGTWMGATRGGLFVGITNQHTERLLPPAPRSRGEVVLAALEAGTLDGALRVIRSLDPAVYNPFNLLLGDAERLFVAYSWEAPRIEPAELPPGLHVLTNDRLGSPLYPKALRAEELFTPLVGLPWGDLRPALGSALADHRLPPPPPDPPVCDEELRPVALALQALCVHTDRGYGTRSSTVVAVASWGLARYAFADGPPCMTSWREIVLPPCPSSPHAPSCRRSPGRSWRSSPAGRRRPPRRRPPP
jgi:uncharacterized protein with NRDE domain